MTKTEVRGGQVLDGSISLTADVVGTLPVANGGTGSTTASTGSGGVVLGTTPTFTTSIFAPLINGSAAASGTLTLIPTTNGTRGTIVFGNSPTMIYDDVNNRLGIGITPTAVFHSVGSQPASVGTTPGTAATDSFTVVGGAGGNSSIATTGVGGIGGDIAFTNGTGGVANSATTSGTGGAGGATTITAGTGGASAVTGGALSKGGIGGNIILQAGLGGAATVATTKNGGNGGAVSIRAGIGGAGASAAGTAGNLTFQTATLGGALSTKLTISAATMTLADNYDIAVGATNGTIIATLTTQKLGFFGKAPVVQPATPAATAAAIITALQSLGLVA